MDGLVSKAPAKRPTSAVASELEAPAPAKKQRGSLANIFDWGEPEVVQFLDGLCLKDWVPLFEGVDGPTLTQLEDADLVEMGCNKLVPRKRLLGHIKKLQQPEHELLQPLESVSATASSQSAALPLTNGDDSASVQTMDHSLPASSGTSTNHTLMALCDATPPGTKRTASGTPEDRSSTLAASVAVAQEATAEPEPMLAEVNISTMVAANAAQTATEAAALRTEVAEVEALREQACQDVQRLLAVVRSSAFKDGSLAQDFVREVANELQQTRDLITPQEIHIPLFGNTGAGKSTLLNATLCQEVVPTSGWRACTAVPVELKAVDGQSNFYGEVHLKSLEEWFEEVDGFLSDLLMSDRTRVSRREPPRSDDPTPAQVAHDTLCAVYPEAFICTGWSHPWPSKAAALTSLRSSRNRVAQQHRKSQVLKFMQEHAADLAQEVLDFVASPDADDCAAFWPLVKRVRISGAMQSHPSVVLVDAPGVQDSNSARGSVVKQLLFEAKGVAIVSAIKRAANEKVARDMLGERFRRQMVMDGHYSRPLAFVATCTDELTLSELRRNLGTSQVTSEKEAAHLRNEMTKKKVIADCYAGLRHVDRQGDARPSTDEEIRARGILPAVFTTSARDYQKLCGLLDVHVDGFAKVWSSPEETEIPKFRLWLHAQGQKAELEALGVVEKRLGAACRRLETAGSSEMPGNYSDRWVKIARDKVQKTVTASIQQQIVLMRTKVTSMLADRIDAGSRDAAECASHSLLPKCRPANQGGLNHMTFKATTRRHGEWKEDWNELLADPLNRAIAVEWNIALNTSLPECIDVAMQNVRISLFELKEELGLPAPPFEEAAALLSERGSDLKDTLKRRQMELSRAIKDKIKEQMGHSYTSATEQAGAGMDVRQKSVISGQVTRHGASMFKRTSTLLSDELAGLLCHLETKLHGLVLETVSRLERAIKLSSAQKEELKLLRDLRDHCAETVAEIKNALTHRCERSRALGARAREMDTCGDKEQKELPEEVSAMIVEPKIPNEFVCPISHSVMRDPASTSDGHTYERCDIEAWLAEHSTSPVTGVPLVSNVVVPNHSLRKLIEDFEVSSRREKEKTTPSGHESGKEQEKEKHHQEERKKAKEERENDERKARERVDGQESDGEQEEELEQEQEEEEVQRSRLLFVEEDMDTNGIERREEDEGEEQEDRQEMEDRRDREENKVQHEAGCSTGACREELRLSQELGLIVEEKEHAGGEKELDEPNLEEAVEERSHLQQRFEKGLRQCSPIGLDTAGAGSVECQEELQEQDFFSPFATDTSPSEQEESEDGPLG